MDGLAAWLASSVKEVAELCLANSGDLLQPGEGEDTCILGEEAGRIVAEIKIYILELISSRILVLLHCFDGSEIVLYGLLDGFSFPDAPEL